MVCEDLKSDHEEADTRLLLHAKHASCHGKFSNIVIKSPDTAVAILSIYFQSSIAPNLIFLTGAGNTARMINIKQVCNKLSPELCQALIGMHVFTGCDTTSSFYGKGKKKAFEIAEASLYYLKCIYGTR